MVVQYFNTSPPNMRIRRYARVQAGTRLLIHPIDKYTSRPHNLLEVPLCKYYTCYDARKDKLRNEGGNTYIGKDNFGNHVYEREDIKLTRFSDFHPARNPEAYFYNELLKHKPFISESELLPPRVTSYYDAYMQYISNSNITGPRSMEEHIYHYATAHLYDNIDIQKLMQVAHHNLQKYGHITDDMNNISSVGPFKP